MFRVHSPISGTSEVRAKDAHTAMLKVARKDGLNTRRDVGGLWAAQGTAHQVINGHRYSAEATMGSRLV